MKNRLSMTLPIVALVVLVGCDFHLLRDRTPPPLEQTIHRMPPPLYGDAELTRIWDNITSVANTQARRSSTCQTMPIGSKPCGGPWSYIVYSSSTTNVVRLQSLVAQFDEHQAYLNGKLGKFSTCEFVMPPNVAFEGGYCVIAGRSN